MGARYEHSLKRESLHEVITSRRQAFAKKTDHQTDGGSDGRGTDRGGMFVRVY